MDLQRLRVELAERFPVWREDLRVLELCEDPDASPVDNDGRVILYNERRLCRYDEELPSEQSCRL